MLRRFIADEHSEDRAALTGSNAAHLARVLRARIGQQFDISTGDVVRRGTITAVGEERVEFSLGQIVHGPEQRDITLLLAVYKFDRLEWAIEKCTELGVAKIVPAISRRTDSHLAQAAEKRVERWRRISHEAAQQSRRLSAPEITDPVKLKEAMGLAASQKILLAENEEQTTLRDLLTTSGDLSSVALAIGPEGGWTDDELKIFHDSGWLSASLGSTILRAETAAISAMAITQALL